MTGRTDDHGTVEWDEFREVIVSMGSRGRDKAEQYLLENPTPPTGPVEWDELRALIAARVPRDVIDRLAPLPPEQLRPLRPHLKSLRTELLRELSDRSTYHHAYCQLAPLYVAGILCSDGVAETFGWLTHRRLMDTGWNYPDGSSTNNLPRPTLLLLLLPHRERAWQRELAIRLADWLPARGDMDRWEIAAGLAAWSDAELPATDGFITGWVRQGSLIDPTDIYRGHIRQWFGRQGWREPVPAHPTLASWLRAEPRLREFVPRLFEVQDIGAVLASGAHGESAWVPALVELANEGVLDRAQLLDLCLAKLLRGDRPGNLRGFTLLLEKLAPTQDEIASRIGVCISLATTGAPPIAKIAQSELKALHTSGRLTPEELAELSTGVLARGEKQLVMTQLGWLDSALRHDPTQAGELLPAVAVAFGHSATGVQERALRLCAKQLRHAGAELAAELHDAATVLGPALVDEARRILGSTAPTDPADPVVDPDWESRPEPAPSLSPVPNRPLPRPVDGPADLAERLGAALLAKAVADPMEIERLLEGAVLLTRTERAEVAEAMAPLAARYEIQPLYQEAVWGQGLPVALRCLLDMLVGRGHAVSAETADASRAVPPHWRALDGMALLRIYEVVRLCRTLPVPCLLATPTSSDGTVDPAVFAERLRRYDEAGAAPWPDDLAQALLRLPAEARAEAARSAPPETLKSWPETLKAPPETLASRPETLKAPPETLASQPWQEPQLAALDGFLVRTADDLETVGMYHAPRACPRIAPQWTGTAKPDDPSLAARLAMLPDPADAEPFYWGGHDGMMDSVALWPSTAPHHPDLVAGHLIPVLYRQCGDLRRRNPVLPLLAESPAAPGPVTHLALAHALSAVLAENRTAAVDALLIWAARDTLDSGTLGELIAELWKLAVLKPNRFLPALREAAGVGAHRHVWDVVAVMLWVLDDTPTLKGLPDLLVLGRECAVTARIRATVPALDTLADGPAPPRVAKEARRLRGVISD